VVLHVKKNDTALNMLLPNKLYADAKSAAESKNIPMAALVRMALTEWLADNNEQTEDVDINEVFASMPGKEVKGG
jgi:uncharacterized protein YfaQ (DUF2300 family)